MLPKKNPTMYELKVPSTGAKIKFRPYTIREEKLLMLAEQSGEVTVMVNALKEIISACTNEKVKVDDLAVFDLEYIMAKLRSKSVGETVRLQFDCEADPKHDKAVVDMDMSKIEVKFTQGHEKVIKLFDDVGVIMRYPNIEMIETLAKIEENPDVIFGIIYDCIDTIFDKEEMHKASEQKPEEIAAFIDSLEKVEFKKLENFFVTMPKFEHTIEYKCPTCGKEHTKYVAGFENFF
jgi:hypothetical protein